MQIQDLEWVIALDQKLPHSPRWPRSAYEGLLATPTNKLQTFACIAEREGEPAALLIARLLLDGVENPCELEWLAVEASFRRQGIARQLLDALLPWAEAQGAHSIWLEVRASNGAAQQLYLNSGFKPVGRRKSYYRNPAEDAIEMQRHVLTA